MKSIITFALCVGIATIAHAENKTFSQCQAEAGSKTGKERSAFVNACVGTGSAQKKSNGSGQPSTAKTNKTRYLQGEAVGDEILLSKDLWNGYDFDAIGKTAVATRVTKGEFESEDEFAERKKQLIAKPAYSSIGLDSRIAIVVPNIQKYNDSSRALALDHSAQIGYMYDPEAKTLEICPSGSTFTSGQLGYAVESVVSANTTKSEYTAQNAYGAKVNVSEISGTHVTVAIAKGSYPAHCLKQVGVDGPRAQEQLKSAGAVLFGHLKHPYFETSSLYSEATITSPIKIAILVTRLLFVPEEIVIIDRDSRQVVQRASW